MDSPSAEVRPWLIELCRPSASVPTSDYQKLKGFVCALRAYQGDQVQEFVQRHVKRPILVSYCSDATPQSVAVRLRQVLSHTTVQRSGRTTCDFLLQRATYKSLSNTGELDVIVLSHPPVPLSLGKKRWNVLQAYNTFAPSLKDLKHQGFSIFHFCFDRGLRML